MTKSTLVPLLFMFVVSDGDLFPFLSDFIYGVFWPYNQYFLAFAAWLMYAFLTFEPGVEGKEESTKTREIEPKVHEAAVT